MREQMLKISNKKLKIQIIVSAILIAVCGALCIPHLLAAKKVPVEMDSLREGVKPEDYLPIEEYDQLEGKYVSLDVQYVLDTYYKKSGSSSSNIQKYGYLIYDEESGYMLGIYVSAQESRDTWADIKSDTYDWLSGETSREPETVTIKGTFRKMTGSELNNFKNTANEWATDFFECSLNDITLMYTIDTTPNFIASETTFYLALCFAYGFGVWFVVVLIMLLTKAPVSKINKFIRKNNLNETEVENDFASAKSFKGVYVGRKYTYFLYGSKWNMFRNDDLVWAYYYRRTGRYAVSRINAFHYDKKASYVNLSRAVAEEVLQYYAQILPQIIVGYSDELNKEYYRNYNTFLSHRYSAVSQGNAEPASDAADTYSPVFKEQGEYAVRFTYVNTEEQIKTIKAVREIGGYGLAEAKAITDNAGIVLKNVSYNAAQEAERILNQYGNTTEIVNSANL